MFTFDTSPRFYFTIHIGDLSRERLLRGSYVMMIASAHWKRGKFITSRPPTDYLGGFCIDSGGFTAAKKYGKYPWSYQEYINFIRKMSRDMKLDFCAIMDYACEPSVNREIYTSNISRIDAGLRNEIILRDLASDLPWLQVLQGDSLEERAYELEERSKKSLLPEKYAGIGSVCGRGARKAAEVVSFYHQHLPDVRFHGFGMHIGVLDHPVAKYQIRSWDSYGWTWGRGKTQMKMSVERFQKPGETYSAYTHRLAVIYWEKMILPRLNRISVP